MPLKVVVAEDSYLVREVLTQILRDDPELELAAVAEDATGLESAIEDELPDVVLTDIFMPPSQGAEGIHVAARLRESHPEIGVVILSQYAEPAYALELLESGSAGRAYLLKERVGNRAELIAAIRAVASGGPGTAPKIAAALTRERPRG